MKRPSLPPGRVILLTPLMIGAGCHCVTLTNNATADSAVVLVDANDDGVCVDDQVARVVDGAVSLGTFDAPGACNTEIIVFSDGDAVTVSDPSAVFSSSYGTESIDLTPDLINVTLTVWRADGLSGAVPPATTEIALANSLFDSNNAGIRFTATYQNLSGADSTVVNDVALDALNTGLCSSTAPVTGDATIFNAGQINVYYTTQVFTGWECPSVIMIGTTQQPESLTHEFGHAFSLSHTNTSDHNGDGVVDLPNTNIMFGGGVGRVTYTEGQALRMSLNGTSELNTFGYRTGATRTCADAAISATCPWLALDVTPN